MWVCTSTPPGRTYFPAASMHWAPRASRFFPTAWITPFSTSTSAAKTADSVTTVPFWMMVRIGPLLVCFGLPQTKSV